MGFGAGSSPYKPHACAAISKLRLRATRLAGLALQFIGAVAVDEVGDALAEDKGDAGHLQAQQLP